MSSNLTSEPSQMSDSQAANAPQRPGMAIFDDNPNARSKTMQTVEGPHTYGGLNVKPGQPGNYTIGLAEDVGMRRSMEDAYSFVVDFAGIRGQGFWAVFDGHAGKHAAEWCGQNFHTVFLDKLVTKPNDDVPKVIAETFLAVDKEISVFSEDGTTQSGCTAVTAFLRMEDENGRQSFAPPIATLVPPTPLPDNASQVSTTSTTTSTISKKESGGKLGRLVGAAFGSGSASKKAPVEEPAPPKSELKPAFEPKGQFRRVLYTANVGDARAVLCRHGRAVRLTYDHKGSDKKEVQRIQEAGGFVLNNRVNGVLAVTRSLGDSAMKDYVVGSPFTSQTDLTDDDEFIIIACDGLWDVIEDQPAVELIRGAETAQAAAEMLVKHALDNFSHDNVTVQVIKFKKGVGAKRGSLDAGRATSSS